MCVLNNIFSESKNKRIVFSHNDIEGIKLRGYTFDKGFSLLDISKNCDLFLVAPATANVIAKIVHGIADDMLTSTFIAYNGKKLVSPAMNCIN